MAKPVGVWVGVGAALVVAAGVGALWVHVPAAPTSLGECTWVLNPGPRQDCKVAVAAHLLGTDAKAGEAMVKAEFTDTLQRDMVYLEVTRTWSPNDKKYCKLIENAGIRGQCEDIVNRPHLRGASRGAPPPGSPPPGSPPPGSPPPGSPPPGSPPPAN